MAYNQTIVKYLPLLLRYALLRRQTQLMTRYLRAGLHVVLSPFGIFWKVNTAPCQMKSLIGP